MVDVVSKGFECNALEYEVHVTARPGSSGIRSAGSSGASFLKRNATRNEMRRSLHPNPFPRPRWSIKVI